MKLLKKKIKLKDCGFCPNKINPQNEVGGKVQLKDKKPICVKCRIMGTGIADAIKKDKPIFDKEVKKLENKLQLKANKKVQAHALKMQILTGTGRLQANKK